MLFPSNWARPLTLLAAGLLASGCGESDDATDVFDPPSTDAGVVSGSPVTGPVTGSTGAATGSTPPFAGSDTGPSTGGVTPTPDAGSSVAEAGTTGSSPEGGVAVSPPPTTGSCTGKPGAKKGKVEAMVMAGGLARTFIYYAPPNLDPNKPAPLVISPHGFTMAGEDMFTLTGYKELADSEGFVAIFPDGGGVTPWNVGEGINGVGVAVGATHDDQSFVDALIKYVEDDRCLDKEHIFVSGFSMGGYFSNEVACLRSDIAGVAPHSGGSHDLTNCKGSLKPVMILHGDLDWLIIYDNGIETRDRWVKRNGCSMEADTVEVMMGKCEYYKNCKPGAQVAMCTFAGLGHAWAGGNPHLFSSQGYADSSKLAWEFWRKYAW